MSKIIQKIFSKNFVRGLMERVKAGQIEFYFRDDNFPITDDQFILNSSIKIGSDIELKIPDANDHYDYDNSIAIYKAFKSLNETKASDPRLWTYLTHINFWRYMRKRWPAEKFQAEDENDVHSPEQRQIKFILTRYFLQTSNRRHLLRNGIARLWWYAHLTYNERSESPFELTKILLSQQDIAQNLLERSLGSNKIILKNLLIYFKNYDGMNREQIREKIKLVNLASGVKDLQILNEDEFFNILNR